MTTHAMDSTVQALLARDKGILAADESLPTIGKRFAVLGIQNTEDNRRAYRELLFTTAGLGEFISGVILFDETIRQRTEAGQLMTEVLAGQGIVPGIKVDKGTVALANFPDEKLTEGLDGLRGRLIEYRELGAKFTKWRAVIRIDGQLPSRRCLEVNATALAMFAALSQEAGLVPIVEPEVSMRGSHNIARCEEITAVTLQHVFTALAEQRVELTQMLLKTGMVLPGADCPEQASVPEVVANTLRCLRRVVPAAVPGIVFLSGGQGAEVATQRLNAICCSGEAPWRLSFSFGRALQAPALNSWKGSSDNRVAAQGALYHRVQCNGAAVAGEYSETMERANLV